MVSADPANHQALVPFNNASSSTAGKRGNVTHSTGNTKPVDTQGLPVRSAPSGTNFCPTNSGHSRGVRASYALTANSISDPTALRMALQNTVGSNSIAHGRGSQPFVTSTTPNPLNTPVAIRFPGTGIGGASRTAHVDLTQEGNEAVAKSHSSGANHVADIAARFQSEADSRLMKSHNAVATPSHLVTAAGSVPGISNGSIHHADTPRVDSFPIAPKAVLQRYQNPRPGASNDPQSQPTSATAVQESIKMRQPVVIPSVKDDRLVYVLPGGRGPLEFEIIHGNPLYPKGQEVWYDLNGNELTGARAGIYIVNKEENSVTKQIASSVVGKAPLRMVDVMKIISRDSGSTTDSRLSKDGYGALVNAQRGATYNRDGSGRDLAMVAPTSEQILTAHREEPRVPQHDHHMVIPNNERPVPQLGSAPPGHKARQREQTQSGKLFQASSSLDHYTRLIIRAFTDALYDNDLERIMASFEQLQSRKIQIQFVGSAIPTAAAPRTVAAPRMTVSTPPMTVAAPRMTVAPPMAAAPPTAATPPTSAALATQLGQALQIRHCSVKGRSARSRSF